VEKTFDEAADPLLTQPIERPVPLLFARREAVVLDASLGNTTVCQTTAANDYTPDD
jgi:hypothetical protein